MTRLEHLLVILAEECGEVAQRAHKAARFGLSEVQTGQSSNNAVRIMDEWADLIAVVEMVRGESRVFDEAAMDSPRIEQQKRAKQIKVEHYLKYSEQCGTLTKG